MFIALSGLHLNYCFECSWRSVLGLIRGCSVASRLDAFPAVLSSDDAEFVLCSNYHASYYTRRNSMQNEQQPLVIVLMGSTSDWDIMQHCDVTLTEFGVPHECRALSAHRTPSHVAELVSAAEGNGTEVVIAAAGGAAHLAGVVAAHTVLPVLGVPMGSVLNGLDSLLSTVQMPGGIPVGTLAIGKAGAKNAALLAIAILANKRPELREKLHAFRKQQEEKVLAGTLPPSA
jgi:5-(carboxyamino)imidazole ribonucleotide mutase